MDHDTEIPLSQARPPGGDVRVERLALKLSDGYETSVEDGRVHVRWDEVTADRLVVRYYLVRDLWIFSGILLAGGVAAIVVLSYFWVQLRGLQERREAVDLERRDR